MFGGASAHIGRDGCCDGCRWTDLGADGVGIPAMLLGASSLIRRLSNSYGYVFTPEHENGVIIGLA